MISLKITYVHGCLDFIPRFVFIFQPYRINWTAILEILAIPLSFKNNILKYNFLGLLVFHVSILWLTDSSSRDLGAITKPM